MLVTHLVSAVIILAFDLENLADGDTSMSQTVAGYFVLVLQCVFVSTANVSVGYVCMYYSVGLVIFSVYRNVAWIVINEIFPIRGRGEF